MLVSGRRRVLLNSLTRYSAFKIQTKVKCHMSIPICDGHQLFSLFLLVLLGFPFLFLLHSFEKIYDFQQKSRLVVSDSFYPLLVFLEAIHWLEYSLARRRRLITFPCKSLDLNLMVNEDESVCKLPHQMCV